MQRSHRSHRAVIRPAYHAVFIRFLVAAWLLAVCPSAARAADWYVDAAGNCVAGDGSAANPFCAIQTAIVAAASGDSIHIAAGAYFEGIVIDRDLSLIGTGGEQATTLSVLPSSCLLFTESPRAVTVVAGVTCELKGLSILGTGSPSIGRTCGLQVEGTASVQLTDCRIEGHHSLNTAGAGLRNSGNLVLTRCDVKDNSTGVCFSDIPTGRGGGIYNDGALALVASKVSQNRCGDDGGGIYNAGTLTLSSSVVHSNTAYDTGFLVVSGGHGGGVFNEGTLILSSSTITGNLALFGGGLDVAGGAVTLDHTIVASNSLISAFGCGADVCGAVVSMGHNLIGDTIGSAISGAAPGDLYNIDPLFADLEGSLRPGSPCVDAGDPALAATGADLAGSPRLLDGNLDLVMVQDMGALEFANVRLGVSGGTAPGAAFTLELTGTPGLALLLLLGTSSGEIAVWPLGAVFLDLAAPWWVFPAGSTPMSTTATLPLAAPPGLLLVFQAVGLQPSNLAGNLSNAVGLVIQ